MNMIMIKRIGTIGKRSELRMVLGGKRLLMPSPIPQTGSLSPICHNLSVNLYNFHVKFAHFAKLSSILAWYLRNFMWSTLSISQSADLNRSKQWRYSIVAEILQSKLHYRLRYSLNFSFICTVKIMPYHIWHLASMSKPNRSDVAEPSHVLNLSQEDSPMIKETVFSTKF